MDLTMWSMTSRQKLKKREIEKEMNRESEKDLHTEKSNFSSHKKMHHHHHHQRTV